MISQAIAMKKFSAKKLFDAAVSRPAGRRILAWGATKIRQHEKVRRVVTKFNPNADPWTSNLDEFADLRSSYTVDFKSMLQKPISGPIGLIAFEKDDVVEPFIAACKTLGADYEIFDPVCSSFFKRIKLSNCFFYISRPSHVLALQRELFLEKEVALRSYLGKQVYPCLIEHEIYEAKRVLAYFLEANELPHPKTFITYSRSEALSFLESCSFPQVFKTRNGAGSTGVEIIYTKNQGRKLVELLFDALYINKALTDYRDIDYGYIFFQEFVPNVREFRVIKVGDSWFGHEKAKLDEQEFMSGSGVNYWTPPPHELLDFCSDIAHRYGFIVMCFDVFMDEHGQYLINELQTWFGSYNPSQMYVDGVPGRYRQSGQEWVFEAGLFNDLQSVPLRLLAYLNQGV